MLKKYAVPLLLLFFFLLYHSNFRDQSSPGDCVRLEMIDFSIARGDGFSLVNVFKEAGQGTGLLGKEWDHWQTERMDRPPYTALPFLPIYALYNYFKGPITLFSINFLGKFCAVLCALATLLILYGIALNLGASARLALFSTFAFGIATHIWHSVSQGFWSSTGFVPFFAGGLYFLTLPKMKRRHIVLTSFCFGYAFACRQQDVLQIVPFMALLFWNHRKDWIAATVPFVLMAAMVAITNHIQTGTTLGTYGSTGYAHQQSEVRTGLAYGLSGNLFIGFPGLLISPARGLFIYTPLVLLPFIWLGRGIVPVIKNKKFTLIKACLVSLVLELLLLGKFSVWWGGYSWGPRLLTASLPVFFILFVTYFPKKPSSFQRWVIAACLFWGIMVQGLGAYKYHHWVWNWRPEDIDSAPHRLWDISDNPVSRAWNDPFYGTNWRNYSLEY